MMTRRSFFAAGSMAALAAGAKAVAAAPAGTVGAPSSRSDAWTTAEGVKFRFGVAGWTYRLYPLAQTLQDMKSLDLHYLCVKSFHLPLDADGRQVAAFRRKLADFGVEPSAVGPLDFRTRDEAKANFEYAARLGVDTIVGVPYRDAPSGRWEDQIGDVGMCETCSELCEEYKMHFAIHNHGPDQPALFPNSEFNYDAVKNMSPRMGLCLDVGHDFRAGKDPVDAIRKFKDRIFDVHLKNVTDCSAKGRAIELPRGKIDVVKVFRALKDAGYDRTVHLEYEKDCANNYAGMRESVGYARGVLDSLR